MKPVKLSRELISTSVCFAFVFSISSVTRAQTNVSDGQRSAEYTADVNAPADERMLAQTYQEELAAKTKAATAEREARRARSQFEARRGEVDRQLVEKRAKINDLKVKQEELDQQVQAYRTDLKQLEARQTEMETELKRVQDYAKINTEQAMDVKAQLDANRLELTNNLYALQKKREETFRRIDTAQQQINKWHEEIGRTNTEIIQADNTRLEYEKAAAKIGVQVSEMEQRVRDAHEAREIAVAETVQMKDNLKKAQEGFTKTAQQLRDAEKQRDGAKVELGKIRSIYSVEMKKLDEKTAQAHMLKALAENERNRSESETARMNDTLNRVKQLHEEVSLEVVEEQSALMQSKISLGQIRTDLVRELTTADVPGARPRRTLATADSLSSSVSAPIAASGDDSVMPKGGDMAVANKKTREVASTFGGKNWIVKRHCHIYRKPNPSGARYRDVNANDLLQADRHDSTFVKVVVGGGSYGYVRSSCGAFE